MHFQSDQPRTRSKLLSALKLAEKPNKDLTTSSLSHASSRAQERAHQNSQTLDEYDPIFEALDRCSQAPSFYRYEAQRSSKVPTRSPTLPLSPNFRQRVIYSSVDEIKQVNINQNSENQTMALRSNTRGQVLPIPLVKETLDERDPLLVAIAQYIRTPVPSRYTQQRSDDRIALLATIARYTDTVTSSRYAQQRSTRACLRAATPALENTTRNQRLILTPDQADGEVHIGDSSEDEFISLASDHGTDENDHKSGQPSHYSHLVIEFPSYLLQIDTDLFQWSPSKPVQAPRVQQSTPPRTALSDVPTPPVGRLSTSSSPRASSNHVSCPHTLSTSSRIRRPSDIYPLTLWTAPESWKVQRKPVTSNPAFQFRSIDESLVESLPSPSALSINRRGPSGDVLAGLDFMAKLCARRTPDVSLDLERSETLESSGASSVLWK